MLLCPSGASSRPARARHPATRPPFPETAPVREGVRLAVDVGSVRVGVARSDPGGILASPLTVVRSGPGELNELAALVASADAIEVIVGLPTSLSGREGIAAAAARSFAAELAGRLAPIPVRLVDERFTTTQAHDAQRRGGKDSRARRGTVDAAAAAVLLQAALDTERATGNPPGQLVTLPGGADACTRTETPGRRTRTPARSSRPRDSSRHPGPSRPRGSSRHVACSRRPACSRRSRCTTTPATVIRGWPIRGVPRTRRGAGSNGTPAPRPPAGTPRPPAMTRARAASPTTSTAIRSPTARTAAKTTTTSATTPGAG